ncbi:glycoside hydrolase family 16 protein [Edaphobacter aggregans]|uniref:glycoside hydrolase family 16 protein n=1 Tax=Edaphobacter aggregans TaxID=570835 RepID=UPI000AF9EF22|nr:glycoside hydrolase family 16 protein [Edaphobacter aggregans]
MPADRQNNEWKLAWSDEFNGADGTGPDPVKWSFDLGGGGFGNDEFETYTSRLKNVQQRDGNLVITAWKERYTGGDGIARWYTSGRIKSKGMFSQTYGRFEARMKLPLGKGIWPAFWLLGEDVGKVGWPQCGEIDVMENIGEASRIYSTVHGPGYSGGNGILAKFNLREGERVDDSFHTYAVEWEPERIRFFLDDALIVERTPKDLPAGTRWVYDHPFFVILNVAVGGFWPKYPDASTEFPQKMLVDYVRVYARAS